MKSKEAQALLYISPTCFFPQNNFFIQMNFSLIFFFNLLQKMIGIVPMSQFFFLIIFE